MTEAVITVSGLGKKYRLGRAAGGRNGAPYRTLREDLMELPRIVLSRLPARNRKSQTADDQEFWALKDVSFEVKQGEVLGIIGRNGAGKSTLLKILSRITEPTTGKVHINGRVASLLEVGTGFHPELSGRENIYLNGAILGMTRTEIKAKFNEIVAFAEIERFLDTPVKRYSSGMYVRLAFAVAAHLEPEILVIDEVLAVGDMEFQKKCLGKMSEVSGGGRTILFVSHNMAAIRSLCTRAILLQQGSNLIDASVEEVTRSYLDSNSVTNTVWKRELPIPKEEGIYLSEIRIMDGEYQAPEVMTTDMAFQIEVRVEATSAYRNAEVAIRLTNRDGYPVLTTANSDLLQEFERIEIGAHIFRASIPPHLLAAGTYSLLIATLIPGIILFDTSDGQVQFSLEEVGPQGSTMRDSRVGVVNPRLPWEHHRHEFTSLRPPAL